LTVRLKILIIDDEYLVRLGLKSTIDWASYGFDIVGEAEDGQEGLERALALGPDIIITDIRMPFMDGIGLMEQLRQHGLNIKVIVLSGYDDFYYAKQAMAYGAFDYILKPVENEQLVQVVRKLAQVISNERISERIGKQKLTRDLVALLKEIRIHKTPPGAKVVERAIAWIHDHYAEDISVSGIAEHLYISSSYFMRVFKENTGITVNEYITEYRLEKAKKLLRTNRYKIYEVCDYVGFRDPRHFAQLFKKYTKLTPRQYMKLSAYDAPDSRLS